MNLKSVLPLCGIFFLLGFKQVISTSSLIPDDHGECGFLNEEEDLCASYCHKSMKLALGYIVDLQEKNKKLEQNYSERDNGQLSKAVKDLRSIIMKQNIKLAEQFKEGLENLQRQAQESLVEQYNLKNKIEQILTDKKEGNKLEEARNKQNQLITKLKGEIKNLKEDFERQEINLDESKKEVESQRKLLEEYHAKENIYRFQIDELNSEVSSLKEKLENSQTQLSESIDQAGKQTSQLIQTEVDLAECLKMLPKVSCKGLSSGVYKIEIPGADPISALCEGDIEGGGWLVVHKRFGRVDSNRTWCEYRNGFGHLEGEFFIGLEHLHRITHSQTYELYVQVGHYNGSVEFDSYNHFRIGNEIMNYKLESLGEFKGTVINDMGRDLSEAFLTYDRVNDRWTDGNCATVYSGAWQICSYVHFSGMYMTKLDCETSRIGWGTCYSIKSVQMLIRPIRKYTQN